jgi:putative oxidoreductase
MQVVFVVGRILLVLYFVLDGLQRLMNVPGGAEALAQTVAIPFTVTALMAPLEGAFGLSSAQIFALLIGAVELFAALLLAFNVGTRFVAVVLIIFTAVVIFYGHAFWNLPDGQRETAMMQAVLHVSLIGGLLVFVGLGSAVPGERLRSKDV